MYKIIIKITLAISLLSNSSGQGYLCPEALTKGYALRPMAAKDTAVNEYLNQAVAAGTNIDSKVPDSVYPEGIRQAFEKEIGLEGKMVLAGQAVSYIKDEVDVPCYIVDDLESMAVREFNEGRTRFATHTCVLKREATLFTSLEYETNLPLSEKGIMAIPIGYILDKKTGIWYFIEEYVIRQCIPWREKDAEYEKKERVAEKLGALTRRIHDLGIEPTARDLRDITHIRERQNGDVVLTDVNFKELSPSMDITDNLAYIDMSIIIDRLSQSPEEKERLQKIFDESCGLTGDAGIINEANESDTSRPMTADQYWKQNELKFSDSAKVEYFSKELMRWAELPQKERESFRIQPIWDSDSTTLGEKNKEGKTITFTPEVALRLDKIPRGNYYMHKSIFKEAVRQKAGIDPGSNAWILLKKRWMVFSKDEGEKYWLQAKEEFITCSDEERRDILATMEQYQETALPMEYEAILFQYRVSNLTDLVLHCFFGKSYGMVFKSVAGECADMKDEITTRLIRLQQEVISNRRSASAYSFLKKGSIKRAIELYAEAIDRTPSYNLRIANYIAELAVEEPGYAQDCARVAYSLKDKDVWKRYTEIINRCNDSAQVSSLDTQLFKDQARKSVTAIEASA